MIYTAGGSVMDRQFTEALLAFDPSPEPFCSRQICHNFQLVSYGIVHEAVGRENSGNRTHIET